MYKIIVKIVLGDVIVDIKIYIYIQILVVTLTSAFYGDTIPLGDFDYDRKWIQKRRWKNGYFIAPYPEYTAFYMDIGKCKQTLIWPEGKS